MITLKFHQILQLLEFASSKIAENDGREIFDTLVTVKPLNEAGGDIGLYAWLSEKPEAGNVKLETEMPDELIGTVEETLGDPLSLDESVAILAADAMPHSDDYLEVKLEDDAQLELAIDFSKYADGACFGL